MISVSYSGAGSRYAHQALAPEAKEPSLSSYRDNFQMMLSDSAVTPDEKALAQMGKTFVGKKSLLGAQAVMQTVAAAVPGPIGLHLAQATLAATDAKEERGILRKGCEAVVEHSEAYSTPWCLGNLGVRAGEKTDSDKEAVKLRRFFLSQIGESPAESKEVIVDSVLASTEESANENSRALLRKTFELLKGHPELDPREKVLADLGIAFGEKPGDGEAVALRRAVLEGWRAGDDVAGVALKASDGKASWEAKRALMRATLLKMVEQSATEAEKTLAQFGVDIGAKTNSDRDSARMRRAVLETVTGTTVEDPVAALVSVSEKVAELGIDDDTSRSMLRIALLKIEELSQSPAARAVASLGVKVGSGNISDREAAQMRQVAVASLGEEDKWSPACLVAQACLGMVEAKRSWGGARAALLAGFKKIESLPSADPAQRELAQKGIKDGSRVDNDKQATLVRLESMRAIVDREMTLIQEVEDQWHGVLDENGVEIELDSDHLVVGDQVVETSYD